MALPYDSNEGRNVAGAVTALMCGEAYAQSARVAERDGSGSRLLSKSRADARRDSHAPRFRTRGVKAENVQPQLITAAQDRHGDDALTLGEEHGYKNSQVTVLAPTGTIGFMMDCDTTGIERTWRW
jgi:ribonucleoside-diphosphate reductase alpha chain